MSKTSGWFSLALLLGLCGAAAAREPYQSTYVARDAEDMVIVGATVLTGTGEQLKRASVLVVGGRIVAVGENTEPGDARVVDGTGKWLTPGIIDVHSHLGDYPAPGIAATSDGNEATAPNTSNVWAEHSVWPQDPQFPLALAGGVTTLQILPGSANLFGGRGVTLKNVPSRTVQGMKFPGAKHSLKMACGENPKRVYGSRDQTPATRMGNVAGYRLAWARARHRLDVLALAEAAASGAAEPTPPVPPPEPDLGIDTLVGVLKGEILVHNHCYRADEMATMIDLAQEFGYQISAFHHAVESYKVADLLAEAGICSAMWADWWGFKLEAFDAVSQNVALVDKAGACAIVHSDSARGIQRLNQETAKAMASAQRVGMVVDDAKAISWITLNPARSLGLEAETGSIEVGKAADLVLWSGNPFSVYTRAEKVYIDGYLYYDKLDPRRQPLTDFDLEQTTRGKTL